MTLQSSKYLSDYMSNWVADWHLKQQCCPIRWGLDWRQGTGTGQRSGLCWWHNPLAADDRGNRKEIQFLHLVHRGRVISAYPSYHLSIALCSTTSPDHLILVYGKQSIPFIPWIQLVMMNKATKVSLNLTLWCFMPVLLLGIVVAYWNNCEY